jgi:UDP-N-acetylglucosamine diphosphorylase/glucosamine-1-phosphate N-acetyltransferase
MHLCLFEDDRAAALFPLSRTRATYDLRRGQRTLGEATREAFGHPPTLLHARPLIRLVTAAEKESASAPERLPGGGADVLFVNGRFVAQEGDALAALREAVQSGERRAFFANEAGQTTLVAAYVPGAAAALPEDLLQQRALTPAAFSGLPETTLPGVPLAGHPTDLLDALAPALRRDFEAQSKGLNIYERPGADVHDGAQLVEGERVFIGEGATVRPGVVVSAAEGPVFIGEGATIMENAVVRGPSSIGPRGKVKPQAHVEASALGFCCKVGGEVEGTIIQSLSNKAHGGFLGDSYLGRWCNLGAGTTCSNLKNDYGEVSVWNGATGEIEGSGRQFAGLFMGDHAKCGIGTCFNTGTVVDVFANLFDPEGFPPRYVPPFSWGRPREGFSEKGFADYRLEKALRVAEAVMARRDRPFTEAQRELLAAIAGAGKRKRKEGRGRA